MRKLLLPTFLAILTLQKSVAHCPLCTAGAGAAAGIATYLGINFAVIGVLIGGFSWALGSWTGKWVRKKLGGKFGHQDKLIALTIFGSIIIPGYFWMPEATPFTLWMIGDFGTTITINNFLAGSIVGALIVYLAPGLSKKISKARGETLPYQGMTLTLSLLVIAALLFQVLI